MVLYRVVACHYLFLKIIGFVGIGEVTHVTGNYEFTTTDTWK